jgi:hypothetical protein
VLYNERITRGPIYSFIKAVANKWPNRYEWHLSHFFPLDELSFRLRVVK